MRIVDLFVMRVLRLATTLQVVFDLRVVQLITQVHLLDQMLSAVPMDIAYIQ